MMFLADSYGSFSTVMKNAIAQIGVNMVIRFELKAFLKTFAESPIHSRIIGAMQNIINKNSINNEGLIVTLHTV